MSKAPLRCLNQPKLLKRAERKPQAKRARRRERKSEVVVLKRKVSQDPKPKERPSPPKPRKKENRRGLKERKENAGQPEQRSKGSIQAVMPVPPGSWEESVGRSVSFF